MRIWKHYAFSLFSNLAFRWINFLDPKSSGIFGMNSKRMWWMNEWCLIFAFECSYISIALPVIHVVFLWWKERHLGEINKQLKEQVRSFLHQRWNLQRLQKSLSLCCQLDAEGATFRALQGPWCSDATAGGNAFPVQPLQSSGMDREPTLQIGYEFFLPSPRSMLACRSGEHGL